VRSQLPQLGRAVRGGLCRSRCSSPLAPLPWTVATGFLDAKRRYEEAWLLEEHPEYEEYRASVRHSFVPFVW
jgi:protein-S-isoprenylcysteine O-methyltransferase Ste14